MVNGALPRIVSSQIAPLRELGEWIRGEQGRIPRTVIVGFLGYLIWTLAAPPGPAHRFISDLYNIIVPAVAALSAWRTSRHAALDQRTRQAWLACAIGFLAFAFGGVIWFMYDYVVGQRPSVSPADVMFVSYYPLLFWGLLRFPIPRRSRRDILKLSLDVSIVGVTGGATIWHLILDPQVGSGTSTMLEIVLSAAYPVGDLVLLFVGVAVLLRNPALVSRRTLQILTLASLAMFGSDMILGYDVVHAGVYQMGSWTDLGWQAAMMLWVLAAFKQRWGATQLTDDIPMERETAFTISGIPYIAVFVAYGLLIIAARPYWTALGELIGPVVLITALVITRQIIAIRENTHLLTERVAQEARLRQLLAERAAQETRFRSLVQNSSDVITVVDERGTIQFMSPSVERVFGWLPQDALGLNISDIIHRDDATAVSSFMGSLQIKDGTTEPRSLIIRCRSKIGEWRFIETVATVLMDDPTINGIVLNTRDVSERMALHAKLSHQAYHDPLTQLANRSWFHTQVENALERSHGSLNHVAALFLDLDNFKNINDSLGHAAGDEMLVEVGQRLLNATRGADTVARIGGDEFAILVNRVASEADLVIIAERIANSMHAPFALKAGQVFSSVSVGIARGDTGQSTDELLRNADVAMYVSKRREKGSYTIFTPHMHTQASERLGLEIDLRHALMRDELTLFFQPIVALADGRLLGVEALVRWMHPQRGLLMPGDFIAMAEEAGLIQSLGRWVLRAACRQGVQWRSMLPFGTSFIVSVNVSGHQLEQVTFLDDVAAVLQETAFPPSDLLLEVTESVLARDFMATLQRLNALKMLGVRIAIDDFGTGYSSLSVLQQFPADVLKIDKSFINDAVSGENGLAVAQTIVALAKALSLQTVAEGIEHQQQADVLSEMGCGFAQGFYFSRPVGSTQIDELIQRSSIGAMPAKTDALATFHEMLT